MPLRGLPLVLSVLSVAALGCRAQTPSQSQAGPGMLPAPSGPAVVQTGVKLSPEMARRVEVMIRSRSSVTPDYAISFSEPAKSEFPGYDQIIVTFTVSGSTSRPLPFLLSTDGKTLVQFNKFDISKDPRETVSDTGRPARGGPENAPVLIVVFDDLECPFCAEMNATLIPAALDRYKNQVRIVYRDFPLDQHPWAMHAAVDANCLAAVSTPGYWSYVDYVHAHSADLTGDPKTPAKPEPLLDKLALDEGARQHVSLQELSACIQKQDDSKVKASVDEALASPLNIGSAPVLFVNGEKIEGVISVETFDRIIDQALIAAGQTPPPPPPPAATPAPPAAKPGN
jgi:protein-disulfide isomerase